MEIVEIEKNIPILIIKNFYSEFEYSQITEEIDFLKYFELDPNYTESAYIDGKFLKKNKGVFVEEIFNNEILKDKSKILKYNKKIYDNNIIKIIKEINPIWGLLETSNLNTTLISYYRNQDYFLPHTDMSSITVLSYFTNEQFFFGGELVFPENNITIEIQNNMVVYMLGCLRHEVKKIESSSKEIVRTSMAQFFFHQNKYWK
jgi:hypothetical protein